MTGALPLLTGSSDADWLFRSDSRHALTPPFVNTIGEPGLCQVPCDFRTRLLRFANQTQQSIETSSLHLDLISDMMRLHSLFCATADPVLDAAGLLRTSRMRRKQRHDNGRDASADAPTEETSTSLAGTP